MSKFVWRKKPGTGSHTFWQNGQKMRTLPGNQVEATPEELGSFSEEYECLGKVTDNGLDKDAKPPTEDELMEAEDNASSLVLVERGGGYYDVVNPDNLDKPVNSKGMRLLDALNQFGLVEPEIIKKERKRTK